MGNISNKYIFTEKHAFLEVTSRTKTGDQSDPTPRQYYPANMTLHRGFYADEAAGEEPVEYSMISKKGWTMMWAAMFFLTPS